MKLSYKEELIKSAKIKLRYFNKIRKEAEKIREESPEEYEKIIHNANADTEEWEMLLELFKKIEDD